MSAESGEMVSGCRR